MFSTLERRHPARNVIEEGAKPATRRTRLRRSAIVLTAAVTAVVLGTGAALAVSTARSGTGVSRVAVLTETALNEVTSTAFATVGTVTVPVPVAGSLVIARFSSDTKCNGDSGSCRARIVINNEVADPSTNGFAFDDAQPNPGAGSGWEAHSIERVRTATTSGTATVLIQLAAGAGIDEFAFADWALSVWVVNP